jgi:5-(carboxyamino)imidazole ribonucleotide synthase
MKTILPGSTIGILGGGQLGRMMALAAQQMGYRVVGYTPEHETPISQVCAKTIVAPFEDTDAIRLFAQEVSVLTIEFENLPEKSLEEAEKITRVAPSLEAVHVSQNRLRQKTYLTDHGFPVVPFFHVSSTDSLELAINKIGLPAVLKTSGYGYRGKGQCFVDSAERARTAYLSQFDKTDCIFDKYIHFEKEISVVVGRGAYGELHAFGPIENVHRNHVLDHSASPAQISWRLATEARNIAGAIAESLDVIGLLCVEFFVADNDRLLINEIAPRPHNSGHYSLEACPTSQFEQHIRAITGMPLGKVEQHSAACMANLLGDLWEKGEPEWSYTLEIPDVHLHLYGKKQARPGRKMGHLTACARWTEQAREQVLRARDRLSASRIG